MAKLLTTGFMIALLTGRPAFTQSSDSAVVNLAADSPNDCLIRAEPVASAGTDATLASASDSASVVSITQLADLTIGADP